jgi:PAS domain-containing protein
VKRDAWRWKTLSGAALLFGALGAGATFPIRALLTKALCETRHADAQALVNSFVAPIQTAIEHGDDLGRIDELNRLKRIPSVIAVDIAPRVPPQATAAAPLRDQNARLWIQLSARAQRRWEYIALERQITIIAVIGCFGLLTGIFVVRDKRKLLRRFGVFLQKLRSGHKARLSSLRQEQLAIRKEWIRQAISLCPQGLVLLDARQCILTFNAAAASFYPLSPEDVGRHWLDAVPPAIWAPWLKESLDHPQKWIAFSGQPDARAVSLTTFPAREAPSAATTWIVLSEDL